LPLLTSRPLHSSPPLRSSDLVRDGPALFAGHPDTDHHRQRPFHQSASSPDGDIAPSTAPTVAIGPPPFRGVLPHRRELCDGDRRSEEHTSELQSRSDLVCRLL